MRHLSTMYGCRSKSLKSRQATFRRALLSWLRPLRQSTRARSCHPALQCSHHGVMIREWQDTIADDLSRLMTLAGDQQDVTALEIRDGLADRFGAVADLGCTGSVCKNGAADRRRILAARIVIGHDNLVGPFDSDATHDRPLAGVTVAAGTEHHGELSLRVRTQACQRLLERVGLVRIVDKDRRSVAVANKLEPSLGAGEVLQRRECAARLCPHGNCKTRREAGVLDLKGADERQFHFICAAAMHDVDHLREAVDGTAEEFDVFALLA